MISLDEAQARVLGACAPLPPVELALADALGCVLAETIVSDEAVPPFPNTAMDGYAVRAEDTVGAPVRLKVVGTLAAGAPPDLAVGPGEAVRIMTGAPMPPGADAIVMVERTRSESGGDVVIIEHAAGAGDHVRPSGQDVAIGQEVFTSGTVLTPGHLGVLATLGRDRIRAHRRPRVGVLSTGDELRDGPVPLAPGQIRDSNRPTLLGQLAESGFEGVDLGLVPDDEAAITAALERGVADCDAVVTSGGVSMGEFDYVKAILDRLSRDGMAWMQVAIRPAKPLAFGIVRDKPVFGLPGNPVSAMVSYELFARPALRKLAGHTALFRPEVKAVSDEPLRRRPDGKLHLVRVVAHHDDDGRLHVRSSGGQGSNLLRSMALANALALVPDGDGVDAGREVNVVILGTLEGS